MPGGSEFEKRNGASGANQPHEEFLELCALATTGELSEDEQERLAEHLAGCVECREASREFEAVAALGAPLLASALAEAQDSSSERVAIDETRFKSIEFKGPQNNDTQSPSQRADSGPIILANQSSRLRSQVNWNYLWLPFAASIALMAALGIYSYRAGTRHGSETAQSNAAATTNTGAKLAALEQQLADAGHDRELLQTRAAQSDRRIQELERQVKVQSAVLRQAQEAAAQLSQKIASDESEKALVAEQQNDLRQKLAAAEASLGTTRAALASAEQNRQQDRQSGESLEAQINTLNAELHRREETISKQDDLLADDRDIRDLMGARDLYIAEVYDVGRDGVTRKPYGRIFYTKGKSLIFYAYDLDQQPGVKNASTFQAWGQNGPNREQAINLGIFYQDGAAKKRWVLKFDDPQKLAQINAVFVTIEPHGGSNKPAGRPLLFASLRIQPNHP